MDLRELFTMKIMLLTNFTLNKIAVCTKHLVNLSSFFRVVSDKLVSVVNVAKFSNTVPSVDMVHLQGSCVIEPTVDTLTAKEVQNKLALLVPAFVSGSINRSSTRFCMEVFTHILSVRHTNIISQEWI